MNNFYAILLVYIRMLIENLNLDYTN